MPIDLVTWLEEIGLGRHFELFQQHGLDLDIVGDLSEADLKGLGLSLGDRKRFIREAVALNVRPGLERGGKASGSDASAERRRLTILFCDLVDSTVLANRLDPEAVGSIIVRYLRIVEEIVDRFEGHVDRLVGDGALVYFGWPVAHEDQVERAVAAGLEIVRRVARLETEPGVDLKCRVGIATGDVVVGEIFGAKERWETVVGPTPNLAARLQAAASPQSVVVDGPTYRELRSSFLMEPLPPLNLKGFSEPVLAWRALAPLPRESRFSARLSAPSPVVGRDAELALILESWRRASHGDGQAVLVSGEPGIGKSRLLEDLIESVGLPTEACLRFQCDPLYRDTPLHPLLQQLSRSFGLVAADEISDRRTKIADAVGPLFHDDGETVERFAGLFAAPGRNVDETESPAIRRQRTIEALVEYIIRRAEKQPVIVLVEDIQWTDPTTEHVLSLIVRRLDAHPILLAATSRDPFPAGWFVGPQVAAVPLAKLDRQASARLVRNTGSEPLDESMVLRIADSADGIPLFLEEMTKYVIEEGGGVSEKVPERGGLTLPKTLQASLNSRLDHLGTAKRVAQIGAVVGREFKVALVAEVIGCEPKELRPDFERLLDSGLIYDGLHGADSTLGYKHALMHEAAYRSLLLSERRRLHGRVLDAYEKRLPQPPDEFAQVLGQHAFQAERWDKAALYLGLAYSYAVNRSANREAISLFNRAIEVIAKLPQQIGARQAIDLRLHAFTAFHTLGDNDKLVELIQEAERLAQVIGDRRRSAAAAVQTAFALWMQGKHPQAQERAQSALSLTQLPDDFSIVVSALFNLANIHHAQGNVAQAVNLHRQVLSMLQGGRENKRLGWPAAPSAFARAFASWYLIELGEFEEAAQLLREADPYIEPKEPHGRVMLDLGRGNLLMRRGDFDPAVDVLAPTLDLCQRAEVLTMLPMVSGWFGQALCGAGRISEALQVLTDAVDRQTYKFGGKYTWIHLRLALAEAYRLDGQLERAASEAELARRIADECGEIVHRSYAILELGRIALGRCDPSLALRNAEAALSEGRPRGLRPFVAECLCVKARAYGALREASARAATMEEARRLIAQLGLDERRFPALQITTA